MNDPLSDLAPLLRRCRDGMTAIFRSSARSEWPDRLAELLGQLVPHASFTACLLHNGGANSLAVRPANEVLYGELQRVMRSPLSPSAPLPLETLPGQRLLAAAIHFEERPRGYLALAFAGAEAEETARAETLLTAAASFAALSWTAQALKRQQAELSRFALLGQAFAGLSHDLNNALNSMMLQTSVVQLRVDAAARQELAAIRQQGAQAAGLLRSLHHLVHERREQFYAVDLHEVLVEVLEEDEALCPVALDLSANAPRLAGTHAALKQLLHLLLRGVCAGTKSAVKAATETQPALALTLSLADADRHGAEDESLLQAALWENLDEIGRQAGQSLVRQLGATLTAERLDEGGLLLRLAFPVAPKGTPSSLTNR
jgi:signal transduction histidine kinase